MSCEKEVEVTRFSCRPVGLSGARTDTGRVLRKTHNAYVCQYDTSKYYSTKFYNSTTDSVYFDLS